MFFARCYDNISAASVPASTVELKSSIDLPPSDAVVACSAKGANHINSADYAEQ